MTRRQRETLTVANYWRRGYRIAENTVANPGFYWRPDDDLSWTPIRTFPTRGLAEADLRRHLAECDKWESDYED
jgi:hypothetical protein